MNFRKQWASCREVAADRVGRTKSRGWVVSGTLAHRESREEIFATIHALQERGLSYSPSAGFNRGKCS